MTARPTSGPAGPEAGGGECGALVQAHDWGATPLGPIASWPAPLKTATAICLEAHSATCVFWGPDLVALYNDAFARLFGAGHPAAMGTSLREIRHEISDRIEPVVRGVLETGRAAGADDQPLPVERDGVRRHAWFTFSFGPIRDATGAVAGVYAAAHETTERVLAMRRLAALAEASREVPAVRPGEPEVLVVDDDDDRRGRAREMEDVALALQRSLLPRELPNVLGAELCGRYVPASESLEVGGDFYDATALGDGRVVVTIGDVAGHGVFAAAVMGQVRQAVRAYAFEGHPPAALMDRLDLLVSDSDLAMTTCLCGIFDPDTGILRFANAGHPPPLVRRTDGTVERVTAALSHPLGVTMAHRHEEAEVKLEVGEALLLYTDGLVERRGEVIDVGIDRLADRLSASFESAAEACERIVSALDDGLPDDVAILAVARTAMAEETLHTVVHAHPNRLAELRRRLIAWLAAHGASREEATDVVLATHEAAMNAIEHAYGPGDAEIVVTAALRGGVVEVAIHDTGRWRESRSQHRGRGRSIMSALMDDVSIDTSPSGSTVHLRRRLRDPEGE